MPNTQHAVFYVRCLCLKFYSNPLFYDKQNYNKIVFKRSEFSKDVILNLLAIFLFLLNIHFQCTLGILTEKNDLWMQLKTQQVLHVPTSSQSSPQRDWFGEDWAGVTDMKQRLCQPAMASSPPHHSSHQPCGAPAASWQGSVCLCTQLHTIFISWKCFPHLPFSCPWFLLPPDCI